jgi:hypothetical protein
LMAGVPQRSDEELAEADVGGEVVAVVPDDAWAVMCGRSGLLVAVLRAAEDGGFEAVAAMLAPFGVTVTRPPPAGGEGRHEVPDVSPGVLHRAGSEGGRILPGGRDHSAR